MMVIVIVVAQGVGTRPGKDSCSKCLRYYVSASTSVDAYKKLLSRKVSYGGGGDGMRLVP